MLSTLKAAAAGSVAQITGETVVVEDDGQILAICPYHDYIQAWYGFRDTWID